MHYHGLAQWQQGNRNEAYTFLQQALTIFEQHDAPHAVLRTLVELGIQESGLGNVETSQRRFLQARELMRHTSNEWAETVVMVRLCILAEQQGAYEDCRHWGRQAMALCRRTGNLPMLSAVLNSLGHVALSEAKWQEAEGLLLQAVTINDQFNLKLNSLFTHWFLGVVKREQKEFDSAETHLETALDTATHFGNAWWESYILTDVARLAQQQGRTLAVRHTVERGLQLAKQVNNDKAIGKFKQIQRELA